MAESDTQTLLELAKHAAEEAGRAIFDIYQSGDFASYNKHDDSPVTSADYRANEIITNILQARTPDIPIMSEEINNGSLADRAHWQRYWLIDPIDGTQEFISRSGDFAVNIALIEDNQPVIGVIYWPPEQTLFYAARGHGAYKTSPSEQTPIKVRQLDDPHDGVVMVAISRRQARDKVMSKMSDDRQYQTLSQGSCSLKACSVAEGKADLFLRIGVTGEWDTGASQCIVTEAGGQVLAADFSPLTYNERDSLVNPDFVVVGDEQVDWKNIIKHQLDNKYENS